MSNMNCDDNKMMRNKKILYISLSFVLISVFVYSAILFVNRDNRVAVASGDDPVSNITQPDKLAKTTTTLPVPGLPQPQDSPKDPYEKVPVESIGTIEIPAIGLNTSIYEGIWLTVLNVGPGHWPGTAQAGGYGNMVIAGHRVTHSKPFRNIDKLVEGDEIVVTQANTRYVYHVTGHQIVSPKDVWIVDQTPGYRITLFACHPPGSAAQRYVIYGELASSTPI